MSDASKAIVRRSYAGAGVKAKVAATRESLVGIQVHFADQIAEDNKVASRIAVSARHLDGTEFRTSLISIAHITDGRIVAEWGHAEAVAAGQPD